MSNLVVTKQSGALPMAPEQVDILRKTLFKGFNDDEMAFSLAVCSRTGLDPFMRQVHFTKRKNHATKEETIVITTGIDGFRLTATRTGAYAGSDEPIFVEDEKGPTMARVTVWKIVQGVKCSFTGSARWAEFYPGDGAPGFMWRKMPFVMLAKCAEAQALRKAFPAELSNIYSNEEMGQASNEKTVIQTKAKELTAQVQQTEAVPDFESAAYFSGEHSDIEGAALPDGPGEYVSRVGKNKGKKIKDIKASELSAFVDWYDKEISEGKTPHGDVVEYYNKIHEFIAPFNEEQK